MYVQNSMSENRGGVESSKFASKRNNHSGDDASSFSSTEMIQFIPLDLLRVTSRIDSIFFGGMVPRNNFLPTVE